VRARRATCTDRERVQRGCFVIFNAKEGAAEKTREETERKKKALPNFLNLFFEFFAPQQMSKRLNFFLRVRSTTRGEEKKSEREEEKTNNDLFLLFFFREYLNE